MTAIALASPPPAPPLTRRRSAAIAGVAGGLADHLGLRTGPMRALFAVGTALGGLGALLYIWLWAFAPLEAGGERVTRRIPVAVALLVTAAMCGVITIPYVVEIVRFGYASPVLALSLLAGVALTTGAGLWSALVDRADPARGPRHSAITRTAATILLVGAAFAAVIATSGTQQFALGLLALGALACIALVWSSTWIQRFRELQVARIEGIREEQRAVMAAHLHDSVLQTLALIQNRAGASSEAGRLARAQERELRAWLYDGDTPADSDLATDLRDYGSALELDYSAAVTVVATGASTERATGEVAAAAREAMLNAARHAGGDVSVYIEGSDGAVDVFVRDRGPGFDLDAVPEDRLGVRESIIGRMRRAGGSAAVTQGVAGGTEVHIRHASMPEGVRG
ncbi:ATP-binding protein [Microbacterium karelineae]|uniref:ATP-binding protein n=1 Tax=Microbacterium karelineae TaxID=2654283 RepID=UPI0012E9B9D5|nr:ATP-binding protein [Microbacterium karelineae]